MAALHAALFACELRPGTTVLASQDLYGATQSLLAQVFGAFDVRTVTADFADPQAVREKAREVKPRAIIAETISNPLLKVCDLDEYGAIAREHGARFVVDSTFATPYLCRPIEHGADFVVHSATKYLSGHADVTGGVVVTRDISDMPALIGVMKLAGGILGPYEAHEILRGVKTLALRVERQCENAHALAHALSKDDRVARVHYPDFKSSPEALARTLRPPHAGALVAIELADNSREAAFRFMDAVKVAIRSTSLGDVFTSVLHPATASHRDVAPARRQKLGITDGLVRISLGIEDINDIIADVRQALAAAVPASVVGAKR
jgi:cystathionine gamma-synthase/methionine-gamma-lyase